MHPDLITTSVWTDKNVELLKRMWTDEGKSASACAIELGQGITRSAVISKVHGLKLPKRDNDIRARPSAQGKKGRSGNPGQPSVLSIQHRRDGRNGNGLAFKIAKRRSEGLSLDQVFGRRTDPKLVIEQGIDVTNRIGLMDVGANDCKWIDGDPLTADHSFCGKPVKPGTSWCPTHQARVFNKVAE